MSVVEAWRCGECDEFYTDEDDARECCAPRIDEGYLCTACNTFHPTEEEAQLCHPPEEEPEGGWPAGYPHLPALELEAQGQQRLLP